MLRKVFQDWGAVVQRCSRCGGVWDVGFTFQRLEVRRTLFVRINAINPTTLPIAPVCNILQPLIVPAVLKILGAH